MEQFLWLCKKTTQFSKTKIIYPSQKWRSLSIFKFVKESTKHQIASVSLTMQDRAISSKFLKHTVSKVTTLPKNHFSYILALLSYKQNVLSCHYFSFLGRFVFASNPLVSFCILTQLTEFSFNGEKHFEILVCMYMMLFISS